MGQFIESTLSASRENNQTASDRVNQFLTRFSSRQRLLRGSRAIALSLVALLLGILLIVALDYWLNMEAAWRWSLTSFVYLAATILAWKRGGFRFFFRPPMEEIAWSVEKIQPSLHESLMAMVQLRGADGKTRSGSQHFLDAIERKVARELSYLNIQTILPWKPNYKSMVALTGLLWLILVACFIPNIRFAERFVKALVPFLSLEGTDGVVSAQSALEQSPKVVGFRFEIVAPEYAAIPNAIKTSQRGDLQVLKGSTLKLEIDVDQPVFSASIAMEYSDTGRKQIVSLQVPATVRDRKKLLSDGLSPNAVQRLITEIFVEESCIYEVRLASEKKVDGKRLENTYSPRYRIEAIDDPAAELKWNTNNKTPWQAPPQSNQVFLVADDEPIDLSLSVADNLPVDKLEQEVSINRGAWFTLNPALAAHAVSAVPEETLSEATQSKSFSTVEWRWDFEKLEVQSGDSIATRVIAIDRKGNKSQSSSLVFSIAAKGFDRQRHQSLLNRCRLVPLLDALSESINKDRETLRPKLERLKSGNLSDQEQKSAIDDLNSIIAECVKATQSIRSTALLLTKEAARCVDQSEIELVFRWVDRMEKEWLAELQHGVTVCLKQVAIDQSDANRAQWSKWEQQMNSDRMLKAYDASCDGAKQVSIVFRQIVGLELQSAMTRDLTDLRDYLQKALIGTPLADGKSLGRISEVTIQYLDNIAKLATQVDPNVPSELRGRLAEWYQWMDLTRTDLNDLVLQEPLDQIPKLTSRLEKCNTELKRIRWVFHLQGNLARDVSNGRRDLLVRSGQVSQSFQHLLNKQSESAELTKNRALATDLLVDGKASILEEVNGPIASALTQLSDRREIHQSRQNSDSDFVSDLGLAQRAWKHLLHRINEESLEANQIVLDAKSLASAFRVLEAFHETMEARKTVQSLMPIEQFDWQSMEAQLWSTKQLESIPSRLEIAHQWMKDAGFAHAIADRYNRLRWSEPWNQIQLKIQPRRDVNHVNLVSAAEEIRALLLMWTDADLAAQPMVDKAREILAKLSPSISQLAENASKMASQVQKSIEEIGASKQLGQDETNSQVPTLEQLQYEREASQRGTMELQDALIELANKQNLLDTSEREMAKDSDTALKLLDSVLPEMAQALDALQSNPHNMLHPSSNSIQSASQAVSKSIEALDKIAKHFSKREEQQQKTDIPNRPSSNGEPLDSLAKNVGDASEKGAEMGPQVAENDAYDRAESLAELDNSDTESLLSKLEAELKRNPSMQNELSEISKGNIRSQSSELQIASEVESALAKDLENSDSGLSGEKRLQLEQLRNAAEQMERIGLRMLGNAQQASQRASAKEQASTLEKASIELRQEVQNVRTLSDNASSHEIESAARGLAEKIERSQNQIAAANKGISPLVEQLTSKEERVRQTIRSEARNIQNQNRTEWNHQGKEHVLQTQRQLDASKRRLQKAQTDYSQAAKDRKALQDKVRANPKDKQLEDQLLQVTNSAEQAYVKQLWEEQIAAQAEVISTNAKKRLDELEKLDRADLDRPNPHAALAIEHLDIANNELTQLRGQTDRILQSVKQLPVARTPSRKLEEDQTQQERVQNRVADVSKELARSGRHEDRLGNAKGAQELEQQSQRISELANGAVEAAQRELENASKDTRAMEEQQASEIRSQEVQSNFQRADSGLAQQSLIASSKALENESKRTSELVGPLNAPVPSPLDSQGRSNGTDAASNELRWLDGREMARMLDLLDRQLHQDVDRSETPKTMDDSQQPAPKKSGDEAQSNNSATQNSKPGTQNSKGAKGDQDRNGTRSAFKDSVKTAAEKLASAMGQGRLSQREATRQRMNDSKPSVDNPPKGKQGSRDLSNVDIGADSVLPGMSQSKGRDWGKLREQRAKDAVEGRRDEYDPEFEEAIQAYYRALGNR